jgi:hypothetical protein
VNVAGLQKPWQHWKSSVQAVPEVRHAAGRHSPATHAPSQQSFVDRQEDDGGPQARSRHWPPTHAEPAQHSSLMTQPRPGAVQLPSPPAQRPPTHCFEQHTDAARHVSPPGAQPQTPPRHWPSQQSELNAHVAPAAWHGRRHWPPSQAPWQHSAVLPQGWRRATHSGGGGVVVPHAVSRKDSAGRSPARETRME